MSILDALLFGGFALYMLWDGWRRARRRESADDYLLAGRRVPWWAMGLSLMATQASAITLVGTAGKGFMDGTRFVQFYYALPLAVVILCFSLVPLFHRLRLYTAYQYLEGRFDRRTRLFAAGVFLLSRGVGLAVVIYAPSTLLEVVFGIPKEVAILGMGFLAVAYTTLGGLGAVIATDVKQMGVMVLGLATAAVLLISDLDPQIGLGGALRVAEASGRLELWDTHFDPSDRYNIWSSLLGSTVLFLAYFGVDQSQVQRHLAGRSLKDKRAALLGAAFLKIPFQLLILGIGVLLHIAFLSGGPTSFRTGSSVEGANAAAFEIERAECARISRLVAAGQADRGLGLKERFEKLELWRRRLAVEGGLSEKEVSEEANFVFPRYVKDHFPSGLLGLFLAAVLAAALSSIDSELNSMATVGSVDLMALDGSDAPRLVRATRGWTIALGLVATSFAFVVGSGPLIETVNRLGSYFYGPLLGVFALGFLDRRANGPGACAGMIGGFVAVYAAGQLDVAWLYLNPAGLFGVLIIGAVASRLLPKEN